MTQETIRRNYDRLSRWYDWLAGGEQRFTRAGLRLLNAQPGERVLEIGPGTGHALAELAEAGGRAVGLDLSAGMLERASRTLRKAGAQAAGLCQGDALQLPFPARSFHCIFASFTLELLPEREIFAALAECHRVLKTYGRLGVVAMAKENRPMVRLYERLHRRWPQVLDCRPIQVHGILIRAGFEIQEAERRLMAGLPVEIVTAGPK